MKLVSENTHHPFKWREDWLLKISYWGLVKIHNNLKEDLWSTRDRLIAVKWINAFMNECSRKQLGQYRPVINIDVLSVPTWVYLTLLRIGVNMRYQSKSMRRVKVAEAIQFINQLSFVGTIINTSSFAESLVCRVSGLPSQSLSDG